MSYGNPYDLVKNPQACIAWHEGRLAGVRAVAICLRPSKVKTEAERDIARMERELASVQRVAKGLEG